MSYKEENKVSPLVLIVMYLSFRAVQARTTMHLSHKFPEWSRSLSSKGMSQQAGVRQRTSLDLVIDWTATTKCLTGCYGWEFQTALDVPSGSSAVSSPHCMLEDGALLGGEERLSFSSRHPGVVPASGETKLGRDTSVNSQYKSFLQKWCTVSHWDSVRVYFHVGQSFACI